MAVHPSRLQPLKIFVLAGVPLKNVPDAHRKSPGDDKHFVLVKSKTIRQISETLDMSVATLGDRFGCRISPPVWGTKVKYVVADIATKENTLYYLVEAPGRDHMTWQAYDPS